MGIRYIHFAFQEMLIDGQSDTNQLSLNNFIYFLSGKLPIFLKINIYSV